MHLIRSKPQSLKASKVLLDAGFEQAQAEALAVTVREAVTDHVATKDDLNIVKSDLEKEIGTVRVEMADLRSEMKEMEVRINARMNTIDARMDTKFSSLEAKIAEQSRDIYKHLWFMGLGIVTLTVGLTFALIKLL